MYPFIDFFWLPIYTFGLWLLVSFFVFFYMLKKLSEKYNFDLSIFKNNILWYFVSVFFFSRLFYMIAKWNSLKHIESAKEFFITTDYNFSLFWAIVWFSLVLYINIRLRREKLVKYIDWLVLSFLLILSIWFIWTLFWWQVYWKPTNFWIELTYTHSFSPVQSVRPVFPLPIVYSIIFFILFATLYILSMYLKIKWFIGYIWLLLFSLTILVFENFSGKHDIFNNLMFINMNQILAIWLMIFSFYRLYILSQISSKDTSIIIEHK